MAMADLAIHSSERPVSLAEIAERQEISLSYLEQLFGKLRRNHLVRSVRGPGGGYKLARAGQEIRVADIVVAVDVSKSMLAEDINPSRLERAKREPIVRSFLDVFPGPVTAEDIDK